MITDIPTTAKKRKEIPGTDRREAVIIRMIRKGTRTQGNDVSPLYPKNPPAVGRDEWSRHERSLLAYLIPHQ